MQGNRQVCTKVVQRQVRKVNSSCKEGGMVGGQVVGSQSHQPSAILPVHTEVAQYTLLPAAVWPPDALHVNVGHQCASEI